MSSAEFRTRNTHICRIFRVKTRGTRGAPGPRMLKSSALPWSFFALTILAGACSDKSNNDSPPPCKAGAELCQCTPDHTCDAGLSCLASLCLDLGAGLAGAGALPGVAGEGSDGDAAGAPGSAGETASNAGTGGSTLNIGGSTIGTGGSTISTSGAGGTSNGGSGGRGGSGGSGGGADPFPPDPAGCALVASCPDCCETTGVFALDALDEDATARYVTAFDVTSSAATAEFDFQSSGEVGAIFFHFSSPQDIGALSIGGLGSGGTLEIALVRANGKDGCIYPVLSGSLSSTPSSCWGLGAGPYAALPADQIEVRVRSLSAGRAALNVSRVDYSP